MITIILLSEKLTKTLIVCLTNNEVSLAFRKIETTAGQKPNRVRKSAVEGKKSVPLLFVLTELAVDVLQNNQRFKSFIMRESVSGCVV